MHSVISTLSARAELIAAQDWYENEAPGLGQRFRAAVNAEIERMSSHPRQFPAIYNGLRRACFADFHTRLCSLFNRTRL